MSDVKWKVVNTRYYQNKIRESERKLLTFFVVIDELGGTTQTDHLDCRTSKTQVSACPENLISC